MIDVYDVDVMREKFVGLFGIIGFIRNRRLFGIFMLIVFGGFCYGYE